MNPKSIDSAKNPDLALALPALRRARTRAEELARTTKTALVQVDNGRVVRVQPSAKPDDCAPK
jgi:hypothetical protein